MSEAYKSIERGLKEAIKHASGKKTATRIHHPDVVDIKSVRKNIGMTQAEFANVFAIGLGTLRHWERGDRVPRGPAMTLLNVIAYNHKIVLRALQEQKRKHA